MNKTGVGDVQVGGQNVNLFPIPIISKLEQRPFIELVEKTLDAQESEQRLNTLNTEIDNLVYSLYDLEYDEIRFIISQ